MAQNQSRVVELQIKLQGVQSLQELEEVTAEINNELKDVAINSKEFNQMGSLAQKANSKVKEIGESLAGITSTEKAEAVNKLGQGLVGAFQGAAGASLLFGEKTSEQFQEVIQKVGGLFAVTDGLKKITEAFSAKNIAALKSVVKGWKESTIAAKLFGNGVKTALISTGIGALVVLIGVIIANFDKMKDAGEDALDTIKESNLSILKPLQKIIEYVEDLIDKVGSLGNLFDSIGDWLGSLLRGEGLDEANKKFEETLRIGKELIELRDEYNKSIVDTQQFYDADIELLKAERIDKNAQYIS
jgi:hypothetical protein